MSLTVRKAGRGKARTADLGCAVLEIRERQKALGEEVVKLGWVKAHVDIHGNQRADALAKTGEEDIYPEEPLITEEGLKQGWRRRREVEMSGRSRWRQGSEVGKKGSDQYKPSMMPSLAKQSWASMFPSYLSKSYGIYRQYPPQRNQVGRAASSSSRSDMPNMWLDRDRQPHSPGLHEMRKSAEGGAIGRIWMSGKKKQRNEGARIREKLMEKNRKEKLPKCKRRKVARKLRQQTLRQSPTASPTTMGGKRYKGFAAVGVWVKEATTHERMIVATQATEARKGKGVEVGKQNAHRNRAQVKSWHIHPSNKSAMMWGCIKEDNEGVVHVDQTDAERESILPIIYPKSVRDVKHLRPHDKTRTVARELRPQQDLHPWIRLNGENLRVS
ncbi:hypothetical protein BGX38DRAFT_1328212 [Terfezia claveryi]|nr:hypothetical protein BGX38DRAFT_1328212 [Terfezia claveryi]